MLGPWILIFWVFSERVIALLPHNVSGTSLGVCSHPIVLCYVSSREKEVKLTGTTYFISLQQYTFNIGQMVSGYTIVSLVKGQQ